MANTPLEKLPLTPLSMFMLISATLDTLKVDKNGIYNTSSIDRVILAAYNTQVNDGPTETAIASMQVIAEIKLEPTKIFLHNFRFLNKTRRVTHCNLHKNEIQC